MFSRLHVAVIHIRTGLDYIVVISQGRPHVDGNSGIGNTVENVGSIWKAVEMHSMWIEQVGPDLHAHIGQTEIKLFSFF